MLEEKKQHSQERLQAEPELKIPSVVVFSEINLRLLVAKNDEQAKPKTFVLVKEKEENKQNREIKQNKEIKQYRSTEEIKENKQNKEDTQKKKIKDDEEIKEIRQNHKKDSTKKPTIEGGKPHLIKLKDPIEMKGLEKRSEQEIETPLGKDNKKVRIEKKNETDTDSLVFFIKKIFTIYLTLII